MTTLLQIQSSLFSSGGQSSQLTSDFVSVWQNNHPETQILIRDLAQAPLPHLDAERLTRVSHATRKQGGGTAKTGRCV